MLVDAELSSVWRWYCNRSKKDQDCNRLAVSSSVKKVKFFLGLAVFYRRFVKGYANIAALLHALTKKDQFCLCLAPRSGATMTHHDLSRYYCHLISSNDKIFTYFCVRGTVPASTHCTASTGVGRGPVGCHVLFP